MASVDDAGVVAFTATLRDGTSGVWTGDGRTQTRVALPGVRAVTSHPDLGGGGVCFYGETDSGPAALLAKGGRVLVLAEGPGPAGPSMNEAGVVAFRVGEAAIVAGETVVAEVGAIFAGFEGLPVVTAPGEVVFRADLVDGSQAICAWHAGETRVLVRTGGPFATLGRFPGASDDGTIAFVADGGIWTLDGRIDMPGFASFRTALPTCRGSVFFVGTPEAGTLGVHDPRGERILGFGDRLWGSEVVDFALNAVSVNARGQVALRVALRDGRQGVARVEAG